MISLSGSGTSCPACRLLIAEGETEDEGGGKEGKIVCVREGRERGERDLNMRNIEGMVIERKEQRNHGPKKLFNGHLGSQRSAVNQLSIRDRLC